jgi:Fic family protein
VQIFVHPLLWKTNCGEYFAYSPQKSGEYVVYLPQNNELDMAKYIYQHQEWPNFTWDNKAISVILGRVRSMQGQLVGKMNTLGFPLREEATLTTLTLDVLKSSEIEGEKLSRIQVRSSIARRLGIKVAGLTTASRHVEGVVEMMLDATQNYMQPLTDERLFGWHAALFPTRRSGMYKINTGSYRTGEMQVVSGAMGKEKVHYEAIAAQQVGKEMSRFLIWLNNSTDNDLVIKAAIAHLWFVTIHPFDDGNGRIARTITDLLLARSDGSPQRFYSMSNQILNERKKYYAALEKSQHGNMEITHWLDWFLGCLERTLLSTDKILQSVLYKADFWSNHSNTALNERQRLVLNKLLDGFDGKLKSSKWAKIAKCSPDTALRDIKDLIEKGILRQEPQGGRSTSYELVDRLFS